MRPLADPLSGRCGAAAVLAALLAAAPGARAEDPAPKPASTTLNQMEADAAAAAMDADPALGRLLALCPADLFRQQARPRAGLRQAVPLQVCAEHPETCLAQCLAGADADYCMSLAWTLEAHEPAVAPRYSQMLFNRGCSLGAPSGCTNRGGGMSTQHFPQDPFAAVPKPVRTRCEFRTFASSCTEGDAWGCAMLGSYYHQGTGTPADPAQARRNYEEACRIRPTFKACDFARTGLREMDAAGQ